MSSLLVRLRKIIWVRTVALCRLPFTKVQWWNNQKIVANFRTSAVQQGHHRTFEQCWPKLFVPSGSDLKKASALKRALRSVLLHSVRNAKDSPWNLFPHTAQLDGTCKVLQVWNVKMAQTLTYKCSETRLVFSGLSRLACSSCFVKSFLTPTSRTGSRVIDPKCCWKLKVRTIMNSVASRNVRLHRPTWSQCVEASWL